MTDLMIAPSIWLQRSRHKIDGLILRYDAWFLVLLAVLMVLAFALLAAMTIWCLWNAGGRKFSGNWKWNQNGVSVWIECT